jgi:hypothetical protein
MGVDRLVLPATSLAALLMLLELIKLSVWVVQGCKELT